MLQKLLPALCVAAFLSGISQAQITVYVDQRNGSDLTGTGAQTNPFKTITQSIGTLNAGGGGFLFVEPGLYDVAGNGESYPVSITAATTIQGTKPCGAKIEHPLQGSPVPNAVFSVNSGSFELVDVDIETGHRAIQAFDTNMTLRRVRITGAFRGVVATVNGGSSVVTSVENCRIAAIEQGICIRSFPNSSGDLFVKAGNITAFGSAISLEPTGILSSVSLELVDSIIHHSPSGVVSQPTGQGVVLTVIDNCTFYENGTIPFGGGPVIGGAIVDAAGRTSHTVRNSIFDSNAGAADMPQYSPITYALDTNMLQDPALIGVGGSFAGTAIFAGPTNGTFGDFHLLPGSAAIDAANPTFASTLDIDGDARPDCSGAGLPDIGADEFETPYLYFATPPHIGGSANLKIIGTPGDVWLATYGTGPLANGPVCSNQLSLTTPLLPPPFSGLIPVGGLAIQSIPFPATPSLVGTQIPWQAFLIDPIFQVEYSNVHVHPICN